MAIAGRTYERNYSEMIQGLEGVLIVTDREGHICNLNSPFERLSGFTSEDWDQCPITNLVAPRDVERFLNAFHHSLETGEAVKHDIHFITATHSETELSLTFLPNGEDEFLFIGWENSRKTSNRESVEREIAEARTDSRFKAFRMLEDIPDGFFSVDRDWNLLYLNKEAERIARKRSDEILGRHLWKTYPELIGTKIYEKYTEAMTTGKAARFEEYLPEFNAWFETNLYPSEDGLVVYFRDTTERKHAQEELKRYAAELERSNADLEQFAYIASHDLQEPLRMISSFVTLLAEENGEALSENSNKYIQFAKDGADRMRVLIRDLLEYARVTSVGSRSEKISVATIVNSACLNLKSSIDESRAEISVGSLPNVYGVPSQLTLLFQTIINNALKFRTETPPKIVITAEKQVDGTIFTISDNGIGIAPHHKESIFKIFKRLHSREAYPGTGIGLAIAKKIVERHGGRIWVSSVLGEGSSFHFFLPTRGRYF